jgi:hypothetical protein
MNITGAKERVPLFGKEAAVTEQPLVKSRLRSFHVYRDLYTARCVALSILSETNAEHAASWARWRADAAASDRRRR